MTIVFKLGGSLLSLTGLADKLHLVFGQYIGQKCLIVPGGGSAADVVRDWSRIHQLDDETAHWLAISCMDLSRELLERVLGLRSVTSSEFAERIWATGSPPPPLLLGMTRFASEEEREDDAPPPHDWSVTSDSLAAWTAIRWPAEELILLKSVPIPPGLSANAASERGLVDPYFPSLADRIPRIGWCNLRASTIAVETWLTHPTETALTRPGR